MLLLCAYLTYTHTQCAQASFSFLRTPYRPGEYCVYVRALMSVGSIGLSVVFENKNSLRSFVPPTSHILGRQLYPVCMCVCVYAAFTKYGRMQGISSTHSPVHQFGWRVLSSLRCGVDVAVDRIICSTLFDLLNTNGRKLMPAVLPHETRAYSRTVCVCERGVFIVVEDFCCCCSLLGQYVEQKICLGPSSRTKR